MKINKYIHAALVGLGTVVMVIAYVYSLALLTQYYNPYGGMALSPLRDQPIGFSMNESTIRRTLRVQNQYQFMARDRGSFKIPPAAFGGGYALSLTSAQSWPDWIDQPWWMQ